MPLSDIVNKHLTYTNENGWKYEFWLKSEERIVYCGCLSCSPSYAKADTFERSHPRRPDERQAQLTEVLRGKKSARASSSR